MPIAILKFNLDEPVDIESFATAMNANNFRFALIKIADRLRQTDKYEKEPITSQEFYEILNNNNVNDLF